MDAKNNWVFTHGKTVEEIDNLNANYVRKTCSTADTWNIDQCEALLDKSGRLSHTNLMQ